METLTRTHLVLEYAGGGELYAFVHERGKLSDAEAKPLFAQIVAAVSHMVSVTNYLTIKIITKVIYFSTRKISYIATSKQKILCSQHLE